MTVLQVLWALMVMLGFTTLARADDKPRSKGIDAATVAAYEKLGGIYGGWVETRLWNGEFQGFYFHEGREYAERGIPGFAFRYIPKDPLPDVPVAFAISAEWAEGTDLARLQNLKNLEVLEVGRSALKDEALKVIATFKNLRALGISWTNVTPAGLKQLAGLEHLQSLRLVGEVTDEVIEGVVALKRLRVLDLRHSKIKNLPGLGSLTSLTTLNLAQTDVTPAGLKEVRRLKNLTTLHLHDTHLASVVDEIAPLTNLTTLDVSSTGVKDDDIKVITGFKQLAVLNLSGTAIKNLPQLSLLKNLTRLNLERSGVTESGFKEVGKLAQLIHLKGNHTGLNDTGVKEIAALKNLVTLEMQWTRVSATGLRALAPLKKLTLHGLTGGWPRGGYRIHLAEGAKVNDDTLRALREIGLLHALDLAEGKNGIRPTSAEDVVSLDLDNTEITDAGLKELAVFKNLAKLHLANDWIKDDGLKDLAALKHLTTLHLEWTGVTAAGLRHLAGLKTLTQLQLDSSNVTNKGLLELANCRNLTNLKLYAWGRNRRVTFAGVQEFQFALPKCSIVREE